MAKSTKKAATLDVTIPAAYEVIPTTIPADGVDLDDLVSGSCRGIYSASNGTIDITMSDGVRRNDFPVFTGQIIPGLFGILHDTTPANMNLWAIK